MAEPRNTSSGIPIEPVYGIDDPHLRPPGEYPYTRGPYTTMYRERPWTMRQYAGFGSAAEANARFRALLDAGQTGLSVAFDLPTQMGLDSDHPLAQGEVGRVGVAVDTLDDMRRLFAGIPLDEVSTSMTINATAPMLLALYQIVAEEQGVDPRELRGTVQNDILKEYLARGTYVFPPTPSLRIATDLLAYASKELPKWNPISVSGYHIREAGATAVEEVAFTLANAIAYVQAAIESGMEIDSFAPRISFFWNAHNDLFEEVAKFRAARRMWAELTRERFGAQDPRSWTMRFHAQTAGSTLTAQQPLNNVVRTTIQALAAVLGGTQSLHTNSFDEALGLPTEDSARLALRTQQVLAHESGLTATADPLGGSHYLESLTDQIESRAKTLMDKIDQMGGASQALDFMRSQIDESAYREARAQDVCKSVVVGVNRFQDGARSETPLTKIDAEIERAQIERLESWRTGRDGLRHNEALAEVSVAAADTSNLLYPIKHSLMAGASIGEVTDALKSVFGAY